MTADRPKGPVNPRQQIVDLEKKLLKNGDLCDSERNLLEA